MKLSAKEAAEVYAARNKHKGDVMERREKWTVSQRAVAYLVLNSAVNYGAYWPDEITDWARRLMTGEKRVGAQLVRESITDNQHAALVEQRDLLVAALREMLDIVESEGYADSYVPQVTAARTALATVEQGEGA